MNIRYEDFIGIYDNVFDEGFCEHLINEFEILHQKGVSFDRLNSEGSPAHEKKDYALRFDMRNHDFSDFKNFNSLGYFFQGLQNCFNNYTEMFSILKIFPIKGSQAKIQKTEPGGGYHSFHFERGQNEHSNRILVFMLYLNSLQEGDGGETEFLYQRKRYTPKSNTMILWPADFTHTHRGNIILSDVNKYIITGWFCIE